MDDFASDTDSDYTSYWRDWVSLFYFSSMILLVCLFWWGDFGGVLFGSVVAGLEYLPAKERSPE